MKKLLAVLIATFMICFQCSTVFADEGNIEEVQEILDVQCEENNENFEKTEILLESQDSMNDVEIMQEIITSDNNVVENEESAEIMALADTSTIADTTSTCMILGKTRYILGPGVTLDKLIIRNENNKQVMGYMTTVDLKRNVTLKASYAGYYTSGSTRSDRTAASSSLPWNFATTTNQASSYASAADT